MSTPTISRDGKYRIEVRITRRVTIADLANYLASALRHISETDRLEEIAGGLTLKQIRDAVRDEMDRRGTDHIDGWSDQFSYDETMQRLALAEQHVRRAFPSLNKADREQKQTATPTEQIVPIEESAPTTCRHGNVPRHDATGNPVKACADGFRAPGHVEYGAFNAEGCFYSGDMCAVDAANAAAQEIEVDDDITWGQICAEHDGEPAGTCPECNAA